MAFVRHGSKFILPIPVRRPNLVFDQNKKILQ